MKRRNFENSKHAMAAASASPSTCTSRSRWRALLPAPHAAGVAARLRAQRWRRRGWRWWLCTIGLRRGRQGWSRRPRDDGGLGTDRLAGNTRRLGLPAVPVGCRPFTISPSQSPVLLRSTYKTAMNETSSPSQSPVLLLHAGRAGARRGVVSDVVSEPRGPSRGISLVGSGAASEDSTGGGKPAVVATATQSPTLSGQPLRTLMEVGSRRSWPPPRNRPRARSRDAPPIIFAGSPTHHIRGKPHP